MSTRIRSLLPETAQLSTLFEREDVVARCVELGLHLLICDVRDPQITLSRQTQWKQLSQIKGLTLILIMQEPTPGMQLKALRSGVTDVLVDSPLLEQEIARLSLMRESELRPEGANLDVAIRYYGEAFVTVRGKRVALTKTEYHILRILIDRKGAFVTTKTLTERVWGVELFERKDDLYVYIARLREKLEENAAKPKLIISSRGFGYAFHGDVVIDRQFG